MIRINLLTVEHKPAKAAFSFDATRHLGALGVALFLAAVGFVGWWYWSLNTRAELIEVETQSAQTEVARLKSVLQQVQQFEQRREQLRQRVALIEELRAGQSGPVRLLDEISRFLPERLWLTTMKQAGSELTIDGRTSSLTSLAEFVANLEASLYFSEPVEIVDSQLESQGKDTADLVRFKVKAQFVPPSANGPAKRQGD